MNRIGFASLLCLSVFALNLCASDGATTATTEGSANAGTAAASGTAKTVTAKDIDELRKRIAEQEEQIKKLQESLTAQRDLLESTVRAVSTTAPAVQSGNAKLVNTGGINPVIMPATRAAQPSMPIEEAPLSLKIGSTYITPIGFMDLTWVGRTTNVGSGIGTNFGSIPLNTAPGYHLKDDQFSVQNSRIGARFDALVGGASVLGYWESDFLGNQPANIDVSSNSATFRLRLFYVDVKKGAFEVLGGQSWSMMTPNRKGISPIPADIFYSQDVDVNYQVGLTWARQSGIRVVYNAGNVLHLGVALENPQQYIGGSSGGSTSTLPSNYAACCAGQFNAGSGNYGTPAVSPDVILKGAADFGILHSELAGVFVANKSYITSTAGVVPAAYHTNEGGGVSFNNILSLAKRVNIIETFTYGNGIGRYFFGQGPNSIVNYLGRPTNVKAMGGIAGAELALTKATTFYTYWGQDYFGRALTYDPFNHVFVGYGCATVKNGCSANNRSIQEATFGIQQTLWKDPRYGALAVFGQYSYLDRYLWVGNPHGTHTNMLFLDLRYTLPGAAPKLK